MTQAETLQGHGEPDALHASRRPAASSLAGLLRETEDRIRRAPGVIRHRRALFECLCALGHWSRALEQIQLCARLDASQAPAAHFYRNLIRAELFRLEVFAGRRRPGALLLVPHWLDMSLQALEASAAGAIERADALRHAALAAAPEVPGQSNLGQFTWLSDSDSRLGPACEFVTGGQYAWLPFCQIRQMQLEAPAELLDLVWARATLILEDGSERRGIIPVRYPFDGARGDTGDTGDTADVADVTEALCLARATHWREAGATGVFGMGQKTWMTDAGDAGLLELRECRFGPAPT
jgi:type VI secretion system protein ImpE